MKKRSMLSLFMVIVFLLMFSFTQSAGAASSFNLSREVRVYDVASDAQYRINSTGTYYPGTYYIYKSYRGMLNITRTEGIPGAWINPEDNRTYNRDSEILAYIGGAEVTERREVGQYVVIKAYPLNKSSVYEYSVDDLSSGKAERLIEWSDSPMGVIYLAEPGVRVLRINTRNRFKGGEIEDSRTFKLNVTGVYERVTLIKAYLNSVNISPSPYSKGSEITFTADPMNQGNVYEYSLDELINGKYVRVSDWSDSRIIKYTPLTRGVKIYRVNSRNRLRGGAIEDSRTFTITVK